MAKQPSDYIQKRKSHNYLEHFMEPKYLNEGHNLSGLLHGLGGAVSGFATGYATAKDAQDRKKARKEYLEALKGKSDKMTPEERSKYIEIANRVDTDPEGSWVPVMNPTTKKEEGY